MKYVIQISITLMLLSLFNCEENTMCNTKTTSDAVADFSTAQLLFSTIEYDLYIDNRQLASEHVTSLLDEIKEQAIIYCEGDFVDYQNFIKEIEIYETQILHHSEHWSLEKLRDLKGQYIMMEIQDSYDPFLFNLWRYEEVMYYSTKAAIDPMLDLYEWQEFQSAVDCMNQEWQTVQLHYPSTELLGANHLSYKIQTSAKISLQESMERFNRAVNSDDYIKYDMCDHATALREHYIHYLKTLVDQQNELAPFFINFENIQL